MLNCSFIDETNEYDSYILRFVFLKNLQLTSWKVLDTAVVLSKSYEFGALIFTKVWFILPQCTLNTTVPRNRQKHTPIRDRALLGAACSTVKDTRTEIRVYSLSLSD